ncbi:3-hydroxyacyl-CoA dehydrogenase NAD-binding domain-containing protein [Rhizobium azibense]|uniref:3-hydroxybutyryl-CoA dehydrogenase n=1 Tax=Rhizobium azibense TaxID=1136135 RepID=A0A4R3RPU9_9HYPH|nr:3-hydroxyacyl-CoA dehydrogenase NAD-binding domain-containing protein [Rhizobium azibense]TCU33576.1 3-hydroxybutyryl-CoA dehydrogenase [Rhizobium azibense]
MGEVEYQFHSNDLIAVIGAGSMGRGIAEVALSAGHPVVLYNHRETTLKAADTAIRANYARRLQKGRISEAQSEAELARLRLSTDISEIGHARIVIETIAEDVGLKRQVLTDIERTVTKNAIIATNTSSLSIDRLSSFLGEPRRFVGLHFFNPAPVMKLVEIIPGNRTDAAVADIAERLVTAWGKSSVTCKPTPGFLVNRLARPFYVEAFRLLDEGFDPPHLIDEALRKAGGFRMGPLELTDLIGQDVNFQVTQQIWESMGYDPKYTPSLRQRSLVEAGLLGRKSGTGVFSYGNSEPQSGGKIAVPDESTHPRPEITVYGDIGLLALLVAKADQAGIDVKQVAATPAFAGSIGIDGGPLLRLTDGRTAERVAGELGRGVVLLDLALDYPGTELLLTAASSDVSEEGKRAAHAFLRLGGIKKPTFIDDTPGLVVARIVACLINEAAALVQQRVTTRDEVETAARLGVNYPLGLLEWRDRVGKGWVESAMRNLSELIHPTRYRPTPSFARSEEAPVVRSLAS